MSITRNDLRACVHNFGDVECPTRPIEGAEFDQIARDQGYIKVDGMDDCYTAKLVKVEMEPDGSIIVGLLVDAETASSIVASDDRSVVVFPARLVGGRR